MPYDPLMRWETEGGAIDPANGYEAQPEEAADHAELEPRARRSNERQRRAATAPALRPLEQAAAAP